MLAGTLAVAALVSACGEDTIDGNRSTDTTAPAEPAGTLPATTDTSGSSGTPDKPEVAIPDSLPTELVITDLVEGTGDAAVVGDTVVVHYVGVRSEDGAEFDNSYDAGSPFSVTLGAGMVIQGWDEGLIGVKQGGRRQLDIPADLAYGDSPQGDVIQAGDALTFVVDVVAVIPATDPADAPDVTVAATENRDEIEIEELVAGSGEGVVTGQTVAVHIIGFRADTGEQINSTWDEGQPFQFVTGNGETIPGLELAVEGMTVGSRRQVTVPFLLAFGDAGNPDFGLPAATDMILVIDLIAAY